MKKTIFTLFLAVLLAACTNNTDTSSTSEPISLEFPDRPDAQNPASGNSNWPGSWEFRSDSHSDDIVVAGDTLTADPDVWFTNMTPGWHATMKSPAGIFWHPSSTAAGNYTASANIFLFDPGSRNEGYGMFVGGSNLSQDNQEYLYFLLRKTGEFLVKRRSGDESVTVVDWTANDAIAAWTETSEVNIENALSVSTDGDSVSFAVNGTVVHTMPKGTLQLDGLVGFRLNHGTNVHISAFDVVEATAGE